MSKDFDDRFRPADPASGPYFYYVVNVHKATLDVHVMRPSLSFRFTHSRALKANLPPSKIAKMFERKTTGFLALVSPPSPSLASASKIQEPRPRLSPGRHTVLAWAKRATAPARTAISSIPRQEAIPCPTMSGRGK